MNKNPTWKYLLLLMIVAFGVIYAAPNLYQAEPGVQVIGVRNTDIDQGTLGRVNRTLEDAGIAVKQITLENRAVRARLNSEEDQNKAKQVLKDTLGSNYPVALADMPTTPDWLKSFGGAPMYLGLDLRGGVHFLLQVDMEAAEKTAKDNYFDDVRDVLFIQSLRF